MIKLVTFDLYDTLIELHPPRWERFHAALVKLDLDVPLERVRQADVIAEDYYTIENGARPIRDRPAAEREAFRLDFTARWLEASGVEPSPELVRAARAGYLAEMETPAVETSVGYGYRAYPDVEPALIRLREAGVLRAVISNADADVTELCKAMEFAHEMDLIVTSALVGFEKPDARTYRAALDPLGVEPADALHIGDQPNSDVVGARAIGMRAALIDRYDRHQQGDHDVPVMHDLNVLVDYVLAENGATE